MTREDFMEDTLDVWEIPAESATRVGHPAPFPVELPARLIDLYTYRGDLVLDPFAGSGSAAVAAVRTGRHYVGYDLDESYVELAESRVADERQRVAAGERSLPLRVRVPAHPTPAGVDEEEDDASRAVREGRAARDLARAVIDAAGFVDVRSDQRQPGGVEVDFTARDRAGALWLFAVGGSFTSHRSGLKRADALWKVLGTAAVIHEAAVAPLVVLTTGAPARGSAGAEALRAVTGPGKPVHAVVEMPDRSGLERLRALCENGRLG